MQQIEQKIQDNVLAFIQAYEFRIPLEQIIGDGVVQIRILYKADYFNKNSEFYKKGIGTIIATFASGYEVVVKETVDSIWCFALKDEPFNILEEVWNLSEKQQAIMPELINVLEQGYAYCNKYFNLNLTS